MSAGFWFQQCLNIVQLAGFYLPLAVAFALIQGITRRIFLSFGDFAMFGSFAAIYACFAAMVRGDGDFVASLWALLLAIAAGAALGAIVAKAVMGRKLLENPLAFMIASIGVSIALQEVMRLQSSSREVWVPPLMAGLAVFSVGGDFPVRLSVMSAYAITVGLIAVVLVGLLLGYTRFGLHWRACAQSLKLSALCGLDASMVAHQSFAIAGALAGVTGWTSAIFYGGANFSTGLLVGFKAMFASVIGGFGSIRGAIVGACTLAVIEVLWSALFSTTYRDVAVFMIIIMVLVLRPEGLAGLQGERESEQP